MLLNQATLRRILHLTAQRLRAPRQDAAALDGRKSYSAIRKKNQTQYLYVLKNDYSYL